MKDSLSYFDVNDVLKNLSEKVDDYEGRITALKAIHRLHKKDGGDFASLGKNFDNCKFGGFYTDDDTLKLKYYYSNARSNCNDSWISITIRATDLKEEDKANHTVVNYDCSGNPYNYYMTVDEIEAEIKSTIAVFEKNISGLNEAIDMISNRECEIVNHMIALSSEYRNLRDKHNSLVDTDRSALYHIYYELYNYFN